MQPEFTQPIATPSAAPIAPVAAPQKNRGLIAGMIMCALLGIGGISFGVYGMINASNKTTDISDLNIQYTTKEGESVKIDTDKIEISDDKKTIKIDESNVKKTNPIFASTDQDVLRQTLSARYVMSSNDNIYEVVLGINNGVIDSCSVNQIIRQWNENGQAVTEETKLIKDNCSISGIGGKIYKAVRIGAGQDGYYDIIGFILEDGTVDYLPITDLFANSDTANIKGKVKVSGFITDAFIVGTNGGYTTVFVKGDGSYIKYDESTMVDLSYLH